MDLTAKAAVERQTGDMLGAWWNLGEATTKAVDSGLTLSSIADAVGYSKGSLSKAVTIRSAYDRRTAIEGDTVAQAYNNARVLLGKVSERKVQKFDASKVLAKMDKRQRRAVYALLQAEFTA
jgi:ABC-type Fe2+-enterobactin transport system substrate-binding protein